MAEHANTLIADALNSARGANILIGDDSEGIGEVFKEYFTEAKDGDVLEGGVMDGSDGESEEDGEFVTKEPSCTKDDPLPTAKVILMYCKS